MTEAAANSRESELFESELPIRCPICAARGNWSFDSPFVGVHRCENPECSHLFAANVESTHGVMNDVNPDSEESIYAERNERLVQFWRDAGFLTESTKLLDVGAGTGHLARSIKSRLPEIEIHCVEESDGLREQLEHQGFSVSQNLDGIPTGRRFDAILLIEVIEHVSDPVHFLGRLRELLASGGRIFLTTPCGELRNGSRATNAYDTPEHVQFFSERSLKRAVESAGFDGIDCAYIDALYPRSRSAFSPARLSGFAKRAARPILAALHGPRHLTGFIER